MVLSGQMRLDDHVIDGYDESQHRAAVRGALYSTPGKFLDRNGSF